MTAAGQSDVQNIESFDFGWKFILDDSIEANSDTYDETKCESVQLPDAWRIQLPMKKEIGGCMGFMQGWIGWYRKSFVLPDHY